MDFDKNKILTSVTADQAKAGDIGWFGDSINGIRTRVERWKAPKELTEVLPADYTHRFKVEGNAHTLFYPAPYEFLQEQWVKENDIKVGDKVMVCKKWENGPKGSGYENSMLVGEGDVFKITKIESGCLVCSGKAFHCNVDTGWRLPYFAIEKVKEPEYRPFANAEEFRPYRERWFVGKKDSDVFRVELYCNSGIYEVRGYWSYDELFKDCTFEDGTPAGVEL